MITMAICDDNEDDIKIMKNYVSDYMVRNNLIHSIWTYLTGEELLDSSHYFNIIFLDVAIGDGMNGITIGKKLWSNYRKTKIIYTTSFHQYMEQAVNGVHAFAYLEKPICKDKLMVQLDEVLNIVEEERESGKRIFFETLEIVDYHRIETIIREFNVDDIYYFEYINRKVRIRTIEGDFYINKPMKDLVNRMYEFAFVSCHQSFLINLRYVKKIKGYDLFLMNGEKLPISQKKSAYFREKFNLFIQKTFGINSFI